MRFSFSLRPSQGHRRFVAGVAVLALSGMTATKAMAGANPFMEFYGYGKIVPVPNPAIVNETTAITVTVDNNGDAAATNVQVQLSYNDWGVTFFGWQQIGTATIPSIPASGNANAPFNYVFTNAAHTCLEALITGADQNTDTNDDRGQINMEVVNAGSSFSYDVPVRNEGAAPIVVDIGGNCDNAGLPMVECRHPVKPGQPLAPGEEVRVPVEVDFPPGTPRGTEVIADVTAEDPSHPGDSNYKNHVRFVVRYETAKGLKQDAIAALNAIALTDPKIDKLRLKAIEKIQKSLDSTAWTDDSTVAAMGGAAIMGAELGATRKLTKAASKLTGSDRGSVEDVIAALVDAERILAGSAITAAGGDAEAEVELTEGDVYREAGDGVRAVKQYRKAWKFAIKP